MDDGAHIGVINDNLIVRYRDTDCEVSPLCYGLQNLPLVFRKEVYMSEVQRHIDYYNREQGPYVAQFMSWCDANNIKTNENDVLFPAENNPFELPFGPDYTNYSFERICISYRLFAPIPAIETIELPLPLPQGEKDAPDFSRCTIEEFFALMEKYPVATDYYLFQNKEFYQRFDAVYGKHVFDFFGSGGETIIEQETLHQKK